MSEYLTVYNLNVPGGGVQKSITVSPSTKVYSSYTGEHVWIGPMPKNIKTDVPFLHPNHGKNYHVIEYNPANTSYMVHGIKWTRFD